jgi:hypothetical protein
MCENTKMCYLSFYFITLLFKAMRTNKIITGYFIIIGVVLIFLLLNPKERNTSYDDYMAYRAKSQRLYTQSPYLSTVTYLIKYILEIPGHITGYIAKTSVHIFRDEATAQGYDDEATSISGENNLRNYFIGKGITFGYGYTGIVPEGLFKTPDGDFKMTNLEDATTLSLVDSKGNWHFVYNGTAIFYHTGKVVAYGLLIYLLCCPFFKRKHNTVTLP